MSVFILKIQLHVMGFIPPSASTEVPPWLIHMESILDFMASSHVSSSKLLRVSLWVVGPLFFMSNMFHYSLMINLYFFGTVRILLLIQCACVFRRIDCSFINMNNDLKLSQLICVYLSTLNFIKFNIAPTVFS